MNGKVNQGRNKLIDDGIHKINNEWKKKIIVWIDYIHILSHKQRAREREKGTKKRQTERKKAIPRDKKPSQNKIYFMSTHNVVVLHCTATYLHFFSLLQPEFYQSDTPTLTQTDTDNRTDWCSLTGNAVGGDAEGHGFDSRTGHYCLGIFFLTRTVGNPSGVSRRRAGHSLNQRCQPANANNQWGQPGGKKEKKKQ